MSLWPALPYQAEGLWLRGGVWEMTERETEQGWLEHPVILADWTSLRPYDPITEGPRAYLDFPNLRSDLWQTDRPGWDDAVVLEAGGTPISDRVPQQWQQLLGFVEKYGLPLYWADGLTLEAAMKEARLLAIALRCFQAIDPDGADYRPALRGYFLRLQEDGLGLAGLRSYAPVGFPGYAGRNLLQLADFSHDEGLIKAARAWLQDTINHSPNALMGIHPQQLYHRARQEWQSKYTFESLANVMWYQLHRAIVDHAQIRHCLGCETPFSIERANQTYCEPACRSSANSRRTYWRKKGENDERQHS